MRYVAGLVLFALILGGSIAWGEAFPGARGQTEAELLWTPVGRMATPAGALLVSSAYRKAEWSPPPFSINLFGGPVQLVCARVDRQYQTTDARIVIDAVYAAARTAGFTGNAPDLARPEWSFVHGTTKVALSWSLPAQRAGDGSDSVGVHISDLPEPLGGRCQGTRLGRYPTLLNY